MSELHHLILGHMLYPLYPVCSVEFQVSTPDNVQVADILFDDLREALFTMMLQFYSDFLGSDEKLCELRFRNGRIL